ncbi:MAG: extracellular solute-binding protein [Bacilli bacterium]
MKKNLFKGLGLSLAGLSILTGLGSCGNNTSSEGITLTIWEDESNAEMIETMATEFIGNYKQTYKLADKITVKVVDQSEKSAVEKMSTVSPTGNGPDIASITHDTIPSAVKAGLIDEVYNKADIIDRDTEEAVNAVTYGGKVYGYPITAESMTLMYDKRQLTSSEVVSFDSLKTSGKKIAWDFQVDGAYYCYALNTDSVLFGDDGKDKTKVDIGTEASCANWSTFISSYTDTVSSMTPETSISQLSNKTIAGVISSPFLYSSVVDAIGAENVGLAVLPSLNGVSLRPFSGYKCYAVSKYSKYPALAQSLANYLTSDDSQAVRLNEKSYLPCVKEYTSDMNDIVSNDKTGNLQVFKDSLDNSITMPNIEEMSNFWKPMNAAISELWALKGTAVSTEAVKTKFDAVTEKLK